MFYLDLQFTGQFKVQIIVEEESMLLSILRYIKQKVTLIVGSWVFHVVVGMSTYTLFFSHWPCTLSLFMFLFTKSLNSTHFLLFFLKPWITTHPKELKKS